MNIIVFITICMYLYILFCGNPFSLNTLYVNIYVILSFMRAYSSTGVYPRYIPAWVGGCKDSNVSDTHSLASLSFCLTVFVILMSNIICVMGCRRFEWLTDG